MCGRYLLTTAASDLKRIFGFAELPNLAPRYNIAPTHEVPVVRQRRVPTRQRVFSTLRWGLVPPWAEDPKAGAPLINARAETLTEKAAFRGAFHRRRCLVPADGYYQWREGDATKQPFLIAFPTGEAFAFAGIWERWGPRDDPAAALDSFTIITTAANEFLSGFHHRMPVLLRPESFALWLDPDASLAALQELLAPAPSAWLQATPLGPAANSVKNNGPELLTPAGVVIAGAAAAG